MQAEYATGQSKSVYTWTMDGTKGQNKGNIHRSLLPNFNPRIRANGTRDFANTLGKTVPYRRTNVFIPVDNFQSIADCTTLARSLRFWTAKPNNAALFRFQHLLVIWEWRVFSILANHVVFCWHCQYFNALNNSLIPFPSFGVVHTTCSGYSIFSFKFVKLREHLCNSFFFVVWIPDLLLENPCQYALLVNFSFFVSAYWPCRFFICSNNSASCGRVVSPNGVGYNRPIPVVMEKMYLPSRNSKSMPPFSSVSIKHIMACVYFVADCL